MTRERDFARGTMGAAEDQTAAVMVPETVYETEQHSTEIQILYSAPIILIVMESLYKTLID
jgi:hypothetical protein